MKVLDDPLIMKLPLLTLLFSLILIFGYNQSTHNQEIELNSQSPVTTLAPKAFAEFIGISGRSQKLGNLQYRYFKNTWSEWIIFTPFHEGPTQEDEFYSHYYQAPSITKQVDSIQFKMQQAEATKIHLYYAQSSEPFQTTPTPTACGCDSLVICDRDCWCPAGDCPENSSPSFTDPSHLIVHHSAGHTTSSDFPAVIRYYWDLHVNNRGWSDIGYNWLIDANGVIYQGRKSGNIGAHFSCMNTYTVGICMIGNFQTATPTPEALQSLYKLLRSESCQHNIRVDIQGYHTPSQLDLNHISAHRDGNPSTSPTSCASGTVCPGTNLYNLLPTFDDSVLLNPCYTIETNTPDLVIEQHSYQPYSFDSAQYTVSILNAGESIAKNIEVSIQYNGGEIGNYLLDSLQINQSDTFVVSENLLPSDKDLCSYITPVHDEQSTINNSYCSTITSSRYSSKKQQVTLYPNPFTDQIYIHQNQSSQIQIIAANGQILYQNNIEKDARIQTHTFPKGVYYITLQNKNYTQTHILLK